MAGNKFNDIIQDEKQVLVDFFAEWCGPCKMMKPILEDVKSSLGEKLRIIKVDVDKNPSVSTQYQIMGVPTLIIFKAGKMIWRKSGVVSAAEIRTALQNAS